MVNSGVVSWQGMDWDNGSRLGGNSERLTQRELQVEHTEEHSSFVTRLGCKQKYIWYEGHRTLYFLLTSHSLSPKGLSSTAD